MYLPQHMKFFIIFHTEFLFCPGFFMKLRTRSTSRPQFVKFVSQVTLTSYDLACGSYCERPSLSSELILVEQNKVCVKVICYTWNSISLNIFNEHMIRNEHMIFLLYLASVLLFLVLQSYMVVNFQSHFTHHFLFVIQI